jgi:hypothetical protein
MDYTRNVSAVETIPYFGEFQLGIIDDITRQLAVRRPIAQLQRAFTDDRIAEIIVFASQDKRALADFS